MDSSEPTDVAKSAVGSEATAPADENQRHKDPTAPSSDGSERRAHDRYDLYAQVQVTRESEVHILSTLNISHGGLFLRANPKDLPELEHGVTLELLVFDAEDEELGFAAEGRVVRIVPENLPGQDPGFGVRFDKLSKKTQAKLSALVKALKRTTER